ncbi:MAG: hypothetical protein AAF909_11145 [Pseudomonadota bacterium]
MNAAAPIMPRENSAITRQLLRKVPRNAASFTQNANDFRKKVAQAMFLRLPR